MAEERVRHRLERISLSVEEPLWQGICDYPRVAEILQKENCQILLIGTDPNLTLARTILKTHPETKITVVEKDKEIVQRAKENIPKGMSESDIVSAEFPNVDLADLPKANIVIAKHLLHFLSEEAINKMVTGVREILAPGGLFFTSTPPLMGWKVRRSLDKTWFFYRERNLGWWRGALFIFPK